MSCPRHGHLPSPWHPRECTECFPPHLSELMLADPMGTTPATVEVLSEALVSLRAQLRASDDALRSERAHVMALEAEVAGLKRGLSAVKRDAKEGRELLRQVLAEKHVIDEALRKSTATAIAAEREREARGPNLTHPGTKVRPFGT